MPPPPPPAPPSDSFAHARDHAAITLDENVRLLPSLATSSTTALDARAAYQAGDVAASKAYHMHTHQHATENHSSSQSEYVKSIVFGGLDGIITTFATVTSVAGAQFSAAVVLVLGISHLVADGLSMGVGDTLSSQAEIDFNLAERTRERWEMEHNLEGEIDEMIDIYMKKGISYADAKLILTTLSKYEQPFLNHMMVEELGLPEPNPDFSPLTAGAITMLSFMLFGAVPLLPYLLALFVPGGGWEDVQLSLSVALTVATLFALGAVKGRISQGIEAWWWSGILMAVNGSTAAFIGFLIGWGMSQIVPMPPIA